MSGHHHHHGDGTGKALFVTISVNLALTAAKWIAFAVTGSPSLFGEAAHSSADALNPVVLWFARKRGKRPPDRRHPLGHGRETFFWSLIAALMMLMVGSVLTAWHGIETLISGERPEQSTVALVIMACALVAETYSLARSWKELKGDGSAIRKLRETSDSVLLGIIFENGVDMLAVILALAGFGLYALTGNPVWDGAFSLAIAALLAASSLFLIDRNRSLLIGEAAPRELEERIAAAARSRGSLAEILDISTVMADPHHAACKVTARWDRSWFTGRWHSMPDAKSFHPKRGDWTISLVTSEIESVKASVLRNVHEVSSIELVIVD